MTIERALANGNVCELDRVIAREDEREVQYSTITTRDLSAKDILERTSDRGEYEIQAGDETVKGTVNEVLYKDPFNPLGYLNLTFGEYVEQGRPENFLRTLRYEPINE